MKRYLYIIIGIVILLIIVALFVLAWKKPSPTTTSTGNTGSLPRTGAPPINPPRGIDGTVPGGAPGIGQATGSGLGIISGEKALNYFVDASNTVIMVEPNGKIEQISKEQSVYLSSSEITGMISASFSYDGKKVLAAFGNQFAPQWSVFDVNSKAWTVLPANPMAAAWSPSGYQIAYFTKTGGASALQTLDLASAKAKPKLLLSLPNEDFEISWPSSGTIFLSDRSSALFSGSIFALNLKTNALSTVVQNKVGLEAKWNAGGTTGVILAGNELVRGGQLGIIDNAGTLLHEMTFLTLPSKCVFPSPVVASGMAAQTTSTQKSISKKSTSTTATIVPKTPVAPSLICGVPRNSSDLSLNPLPDAYEERRFMTSDDIYRVSLTDGSVRPIFNDPTQVFDVSNMKVFGDNLFFINRYDQKLYAISLGQ